uniref:Cwf19-like C-terminal domain-containing protein n=1 Tax=Kalanchoe fedtschenkoi TaxID=63787 RepID=A0A7N0T1W2_KALFE
MSANHQLAAKYLLLQMKGKHKEAEEFQRQVDRMKQNSKEELTGMQEGYTSRYRAEHQNVMSESFFTLHMFHILLSDMSHTLQRRKDESDDMHLAQTIMKNKRFTLSGQADDEYDYDGAPQRKPKNKGGSNDRRIKTQQERCEFCFGNPDRPNHLVLSIANHTYLMLPQRQHVVEGHCCIVTMQHESAIRGVDNKVWDEIRNFKKSHYDNKDVVLIETVMGLAQQGRHCLVECIPLPRDVARQALIYFKKAVDDAEDEWSQHDAKKLIDTSKKGLRGSTSMSNDEKQFNGNIGLDVLRGMLHLADEDMYRPS